MRKKCRRLHMGRWICPRALSESVPLLFHEEQQGGLHLSGHLWAMCKATVAIVGAPAGWKEGWPKSCLRKGELFALSLLRSVAGVNAIHMWDYSDSLPKPGKVTKMRLREGINWTSSDDGRYLPSRRGRRVPERLCSPRPQKSLPVPVTGGLLKQLSPKS